MIKKLILQLIIVFSLFIANAETLEHGVVKEYHGKKDKTALAGVELMVKGAQSTISNAEGQFTLRFATLSAGEKVDYTEIFKEGYVIFNKDALDAWRISNNGKPFVVVMCKEADFRQLKKKFYGIIEKNYYDEYQRQKQVCESTIKDNLELDRKLKQIEKEYNAKMSNINTYVELFSRIDQNEMDSIESKSIEYLELGQIDDAIRVYEELELEREMRRQVQKWDAANEMQRAAQLMEQESQADLIMLVDKMQRQLSLYEMGGKKYDDKYFTMVDNLIGLLYRLKPLTGTKYNETLGFLILERDRGKSFANHFQAAKEASELPSAIGLRTLAEEYELVKPSAEIVDSIRNCYEQALEIIGNPTDSIALVIRQALSKIPTGIYQHADGYSYPYRLIGKNEAVLMGYGPYYSTHIEGSVTLPTQIMVNDTMRTVTEIGEFAFGNNRHLQRVVLPQQCRYLGPLAFSDCKDAVIVVNSELDSMCCKELKLAIPLNQRLEIPQTPKNTDWIYSRIMEIENSNDTCLDIAPLVIALSRYYEKEGDKDELLDQYSWLAEYYISKKDLDNGFKYARLTKKYDKQTGLSLLALCYKEAGDLDNAIKIAKQALDDQDAHTYNVLAYYIVQKSQDESSFEQAHALIDKALTMVGEDTQRANLLDSKGEFYLMQGDETKAKEYLDKALGLSSQYWKYAYSVLYHHFYPDAETNSNTPNEFVIKQRDRNIAIALMALDYLRPRLQSIANFNFDTYTNRVLHRVANADNIDADIFYAKADIVFLHIITQMGAQAYSYCQKNMITFKSEWLGLLDPLSDYGFDEDLPFYASTLVAIRQLATNMPCNQLLPSDTKRISSLYRKLNYFSQTLAPSEKCLLDSIMAGHDFIYINEKLGRSKEDVTKLIMSAVDYLNNTNDTNADINSIIDFDKEATRYDERIAQTINSMEQENEYYKLLLDMVYSAARIEYNYILSQENFRVIEIEELVSIGVIALQVIIKNKPFEKIKGYNYFYFAAAIRWAISNELSIRYTWYSKMATLDYSTINANTKYNYELDNLYKEYGLDYKMESVRLSIFDSLYLIAELFEDSDANITKSDRFDTELKDVILDYWKLTQQARNTMSEPYQACFDKIFSKETNISKLLLDRQLEPTMIKEVLETINNFYKENNKPSLFQKDNSSTQN